MTLVIGLASASAAPPSGRVDRARLDRAVRAVLRPSAEGLQAGVWLGGAEGEAWYSVEAKTTFPTASSIKTAFQIELFARYAGALDQPPAGLDAILRDEHPAIAHFRPEQRAEVRKELAGASVRRLGGVMMGSVPASNVVYNAAANITTALLGGPEALTRLIRSRSPAFAPIAVRRYMLADRHVTGDNEATPEALAAVLQALAARRVPGLDAATVDEIRRTLLKRTDPKLGRHFLKNGDLDSDPITRVRTGWYEPPTGPPIVYVVMVAQPDPGKLPRAQAVRRLVETTGKLTERLLEAAR
jgi:hypothetical protein